MTTALQWQAGSHPSPPTHPSEVAFEAFLTSHGYVFDKEPIRFQIGPSSRGKSAEAVTPDYRILQTPDGVLHDNLFIEICEADRYTDLGTLPASVQRKNRRHSASGKAYISPSEYLRRKRERMQRAESLHKVVILVITWSEQQSIISGPTLLVDKIDYRLR